MAIKLHRCSGTFVKIGGHPCWKAQKALDDAGVDYELVLHSGLRFRRPEVAEMTGGLDGNLTATSGIIIASMQPNVEPARPLALQFGVQFAMIAP